jgi:hypothetical protein
MSSTHMEERAGPKGWTRDAQNTLLFPAAKNLQVSALVMVFKTLPPKKACPACDVTHVGSSRRLESGKAMVFGAKPPSHGGVNV